MTVSEVGSATGPDSGTLRRVAAEVRTGGQVSQDTDEGRVQGLVDLLHDRWGDDVEARRASHLLRDAGQQPVCVVAFTEKLAVHPRQPLLTAGSHEQQCSSNQQVPPPACRDQRHERLIAVDDDIGEKQRTKDGDERVD